MAKGYVYVIGTTPVPAKCTPSSSFRRHTSRQRRNTFPLSEIVRMNSLGISSIAAELDQAIASARWLLDHLRAQDRVNLMVFNDIVRRLADQPVALDDARRADCQRFLEGAAAEGGTALGDAIQAACTAPKQQGRAAKPHQAAGPA